MYVVLWFMVCVSVFFFVVVFRFVLVVCLFFIGVCRVLFWVFGWG